jgi:hypothetical protein
MAYSAGTNNETTYEGIRMVEDVSDIIGLISPYDTPVYSSLSKPDCHNRLVEWQEDELRPPAANANVEGADTTLGVVGIPTEKNNRTQIFEESARVSDSIEATDFYGRASEMDYQIMKKGRELRRDIEYTLVGVGILQIPVVGSAAVARQMGGVQYYIDSTTTDENSGTPRDFTEAQVLAVHQLCWAAGGDPNVLFVTGSHSIRVANFAYASGRQRDIGNETRLMNVVDLYVSPFGELSVVTNRWQKATDALLLEMARWDVPTLRSMRTVPLAKTGSNEKVLLDCELSLRHENSKASGLITDLNAV